MSMSKELSDCCWSSWDIKKWPGAKIVHHRLVDYICDSCGNKCSLVSEEFIKEESARQHRLLKKLEDKYGKNFWREEGEV